MIYLGKFCCVCLNARPNLVKLMIQENNLSYYDKLSILIPDMNLNEIKTIAFICNDCKKCVDRTYDFHLQCLANNNRLRRYIKQLCFDEDVGDIRTELIIFEQKMEIPNDNLFMTHSNENNLRFDNNISMECEREINFEEHIKEEILDDDVINHYPLECMSTDDNTNMNLETGHFDSISETIENVVNCELNMLDSRNVTNKHMKYDTSDDNFCSKTEPELENVYVSDDINNVFEMDPNRTGLKDPLENYTRLTQGWESDVIEYLLSKPFSRLEYDEKIEIIRYGRPKPELKNLISVKKSNQEGRQSYTRHFMSTNYKKIEWLSGSANLNKLFCWPCLLFGTEDNIWSKFGFYDLNHLSNALKRHDKSMEHIQNSIQLKMFGKLKNNVLLDEQLALNIIEHNKKVTKNREFLKRLIDVVCFLSKLELPFRGQDETTVNNKNYIEALELVRQFDQLLDTQLQESKIFHGASPLIQNDLIECIASVMDDHIKKEISEANFVSIMLDETSDIYFKSQLSTVIKYATKEKVYERFIGFFDVSADKSADGLFQHFEKIVEKYNIANKLIGQTYDGASVIAGHLNGLKTKILEKYPQAIFTHCYAHELNLVLQQSLYGIQPCRLFFQTLTGLSIFFSKSTKRSNAFQNFVQQKVPSVPPIRWNLTSSLTNVVKQYHVSLIAFFENVIESSIFWDTETIVQSQGFVSFLQNIDTIFLLEVFSNLFSYTDTLNYLLQSRSYDILFCYNKITETKKLLKDQQKNFDNIWDKSSELINQNTVLPKENKDKTFYKRLYNEIYDFIISQLSVRFASFQDLTYLELLRPDLFSSYKVKFPDKTFKKLMDTYPEAFDFMKLKAELSVLYRSLEFKNRPVHMLFTFLYNNDLTTELCETFKLAKLILTIPYTSASDERNFSALQRIKTFIRSTQEQERLSNLGLISIEEELLMKLKNGHFYNDIIDKFLLKRKIDELIYK